jgi:hypothetical protein
MNRNIEQNNQGDLLFNSVGRDEKSIPMILLHAYYLRSRPRRRPTTMSETEQATVVSKGEGTSDCVDTIGGSSALSHNNSPFDSASPDTQSSRTATSPSSIQRSVGHAIDSPPRNHDPLSKRQRIPESSQVRSSMYANKRMRLLIFIKIILKCLDSDDPSLHLKAKKIVTDCTRRNREGVPGYNPLADVITRQLRITVGEVHWERAKRLMEYYLRKRVEKPTTCLEIQR